MTYKDKNRYEKFIKWLFKKTLSNFTSFFYVPLLILLLIITFGIFVFSIICIFSNNEFITCYHYEGFNNLLIFFQFPIAILAGIVVIITLLNSSIRYIQFEEQFELNRHNIYMNNYYKHLDEFIKFLSDLKETVLKTELKNLRALYKIFKKLNKQECRELYYHWYGKEYTSKHEILDNVKKNVKEYYETILKCKNKDELSNKRFTILSGIESKLGFLNFFSRITSDDSEHLDYCYVYICEKILDFSDDDIMNDKGVSIRQKVFKHIDILK